MILLGGDFETRNSSTWEANMNEAIENVTDNRDLLFIKWFNRGLNLEKVLYPRFGFCLQSTNYSLDTIPITLPWKEMENDIMIFLTDTEMKSNSGIHYKSQLGDKMKIETKESQFYGFLADMTIYDWRNSAEEDDCDNHHKLEQCVEEETFRDLNPVLGCVPPWLSSKNGCTHVYNNETLFLYFLINYVDPYWYLMETKAKKKCKLPCEQQV